MYRVLILGLLAGLAAASGGQDDKCLCSVNIAPDRSRHHGLVDAAATRLLAVRVDSIEVRLGEGHKQLEALKKGVHKISHEYDDGEKIIKKLEARLNHIEGNHCEEGHFQCGGPNRKCISELLVCDKHKDCDNNADEEKSLCHVPSATGSVWEANLHGYEGCTQRRVTKVRIVITRETTLNFVPQITRLKATSIVTHVEDEKRSTTIFHLDGVYRPAQQVVEFFPPEDDQIGIKCFFDGVDENQCNAVFTLGHGRTCGHFVIRKTTH